MGRTSGGYEWILVEHERFTPRHRLFALHRRLVHHKKERVKTVELSRELKTSRRRRVRVLTRTFVVGRHALDDAGGNRELRGVRVRAGDCGHAFRRVVDYHFRGVESLRVEREVEHVWVVGLCVVYRRVREYRFLVPFLWCEAYRRN